MPLGPEIQKPSSPEDFKNWAIPFMGRDGELRTFESFVESNDVHEPRRLIVRGDSGTGKSYFVRKAAFDCLQKNSFDIFCLYVDLSNDEFQSSRLLSSLLTLSMLPAEPSYKYPINIPSDVTLEEFKRVSSERKNIGWNIIRGVSQAAASFVGMGDAVKEILVGAGQEATTAEDILTEYLKWVMQHRSIMLIVDNYQFMNHEVRLTLEALLIRIGSDLRFVIVNRTINGASEIIPPLQKLSVCDQEIILSGFSLLETRAVIRETVSGDEKNLDGLSADIFIKTKGLPKDVEYCIRQYLIASYSNPDKIDIYGLLATIDRLPLMHRQFLIIASLLDGGIDLNMARNVVRRIGSLTRDSDLDQALTELIAHEYLKINSDTGTRLRAGHERIVQSMRDVAASDNFDDVRRSLIEEFADILENKKLPDTEAYILHCLVGIQTAAELRGNLHFISRLVRSQYRLDQYAYLVNLASEIDDLVPLLPNSIIILFLDSMQKTSAFEKGLQLTRFLEHNDALSRQERVLYKFKFLSQLYLYEDANKLLSELPKDLWTQVYLVSSLISQDRHHEAKEAAMLALATQDMNEAKAILLRNTITLLSPQDALSNLIIAANYFDGIDSEFRLATIDTNRSFIHICMGNYGEASRALNRAIFLMKRVGSMEIYQAYFNSAIKHSLTTNYDLAKSDFDKATEFVPPSLLLDWVKIEMAKVVFDLVSREIGDETAVESFKDLLRKIRGVQLPYLRRSLEQNIASICHPENALVAEIRDNLASVENISIYLPIPFKGSSTLIVNPSIHLRY